MLLPNIITAADSRVGSAQLSPTRRQKHRAQLLTPKPLLGFALYCNTFECILSMSAP
eukprot:COSAG02_NODE_57181_length_281_cov_1.428571_1_plen_56_part_01